MAWTSEADLEAVFMDDLQRQGFAVHHGKQIDPDSGSTLRKSNRDTILAPVLEEALQRLNPDLPAAALQEAAKRLEDAVFTTDVIQEKPPHSRLDRERHRPFLFCRWRRSQSRVCNWWDWDDQLNDWRAINQVDVVGKTPRIPDVVIFLNGLPAGRGGTSKAPKAQTFPRPFNQIETYKDHIPDLFRTTLLTVISDGIKAKYGSLSAGLDRFMSWRRFD